MAVHSRKTRTASHKRINSNHIPTTWVPFTQRDIRKDGIESATKAVAANLIGQSIEIIIGIVLGAFLMWFYLAFSWKKEYSKLMFFEFLVVSVFFADR